MSTEPLNIYTLVHKLNFINDDFGIVEIDEPFQFDGANFVVEQEKGRYGRDVSFAGEEISFKFVNQQNIKGHQFAKLVEYYKRYGFESRVQYILSENDEDYVVGVLDFKTAETDLFSYFDCKVIQDTSQAILRRRKETKIDVFSETDVKGDAITPVSTSRILFKSKPIIQESIWEVDGLENEQVQAVGIEGGDNGTHQFNILSNLTEIGISNSLNYSSHPIDGVIDLMCIDAQSKLTNVQIDITDLSFDIHTINALGDEFSTFRIYYVVDSVLNNTTIQNASIMYDFGDIADETQYSFTDININETIPIIEQGQKLWIWFRFGSTYLTYTYSSYSGTMSIKTESRFVNTVVDGVRLKDAHSQVIKSINQDFDVVQPRFDVGGEWYNNFVFSGNMIRGLDKPFVLSLKESLEHLKEFNCDYQINGNNIEIIKYDDFYVDEEIASFLLAPDETFKSSYNENYELNQFDFKYKNFNQDKDDENTDDAVHTETENIIQNDQVETIKTIDLPYVRDPFLGESTKRKGIETKPTTSLSQDDKVFIYDVEPMPINSYETITDSLTHDYNSTENTLSISNQGNFNWSVLGFNTGSIIQIDSTISNDGGYLVLDISDLTVVLQPINVNPSDFLSVFTTVIYPLVGVEYQIRTNEGFEAIENVLSPFEYPNLYYTPKNNILNNWLSYLSTASKYNDEDITVSYFKNGGNLLTRLVGGEDVIENAPITYLDNAILDPIILTSKVIANFSQFRDLESKLKTIKGYVTIRDNKGQKRKVHPSRLEFLWSENILNITGELRKESLIMNIVRDNDVIKLMRDGYDDIEVYELNYDVLDGYLEFLNENYVSLTERIKYDLITVDSVSYNNEYDLIAAIQAL